MIRKLLSLRYWRHLFARIWRLLRSPHVRVQHKLLFLLPVALYWVLPDAMPMMPLDDIAVTMLAANWFAGWMERKYPNLT